MRLISTAGAATEDDWEATGQCEGSTLDVEGRYVQLADLNVTHSICPSQDQAPKYSLNSLELIVIARAMFSYLKAESDRLPTATWTTDFPYRLRNGECHTD